MRWYSQAGTPEVAVTARYDAARKTYTLELAQIAAADARPAGQAADGHPARVRPRRPGRPRPAARSRDGRARRRAACSTLTEAAADLRVHRHRASARCPRSTAASRRRSSSSPTSPATICVSSPRTTAIRSTAGRRRRRSRSALLIDNVAAIARRQRAAHRRQADRRRSPPSSRTRRSSRPSSRRRSSCRAKPTSPARSAATSIPTRSSRARTALRAAIGDAARRRRCSTLYERMTVRRAPIRPDAASAGRRALAQRRARPAGGRRRRRRRSPRAARQYETADNMTDRMAALGTLVAARRAASAARARRFLRAATRPIRWSSTNGSRCRRRSRSPTRSTGCAALTHHPAFSLANPNRVRALIGAFAQAQPDPVQPRRRRRLRLHRRHRARARPKQPAGRGAAGDRFPQLARAGGRPARKAEAALRRIEAASDLSRDVADIVERALAPLKRLIRTAAGMPPRRAKLDSPRATAPNLCVTIFQIIDSGLSTNQRPSISIDRDFGEMRHILPVEGD